MDQPLLLIDVDGVISLFGFDQTKPPSGKLVLVDGIPHFLTFQAAALLVELGRDFEQVWCTGWEERADEYLPWAVGAPAGLPHLSFAPSPPGGVPRHWKLAAIDAFAGADRPLAWIDDGFDDSCHEWAARRPGPTELVSTDPAVGFTAEQAAHLRAWARALSGAA